MKTAFFVFLIIAVVSISLYWYRQSPHPASTLQPTSQPQVLGQRRKTSNCTSINHLPDKDCTPGDIIPTATREQICTPGYSKSVRNVPAEIKRQAYDEYGITSHKPGEYEVDHLISLELGGSNSIANLWPEAAEPRPGFHEKDQVENYLHDQVCNGNISLSDVQRKIATDWLSVYSNIPH